MLNLDAELNVICRLVTLAVFQPAKFWLKTVAPENSCDISVAAAVFQPLIGVLNAAAAESIEAMLATLATFQRAKFWLKVEAPEKAFARSVTEAVFHLDISALNAEFWRNNSAMLLTQLVSQSWMAPPYVVSAITGFAV
jgi:hypothetical protein